MLIEYDTAKDQSNQARHGVSLAAAEGFDWDSALIRVDDRNDYGETRYQALGFAGDGRIYLVAFTERGEALRIISMRRATKREEQLYEQA